MDWSVTHAINGFMAGHDAVEDPLRDYVDGARIGFAALIAALFLLSRGAVRFQLRRAAVVAGLAAAVSLGLASLIAHAVDRARPFVTHAGVHLFSAHAADAGFPSDHATAAFAIGTAIFLRHRAWGAAVLVLAAVLAFGRVAMGLHYPSDVVAGAALGTATALGLWAPPVRRRVDAIADRLGATWDIALARARLAWRS